MSFVIDLSGIDCERIKQIWSLPSAAKVLDMTPFGDFFVQVEDGIYLYSLTDGQINNVSDDVAEHGLPPVDIALGDEWYQLDAQIMLKEDGLSLAAQQCFGIKQPVFQDGDYGPDNKALMDIYDYHQTVCDILAKGNDSQ